MKESDDSDDDRSYASPVKEKKEEKVITKPSKFEKLVQDYYTEKYQEMKKTFNKSGLVKDVMDEVGKYDIFDEKSKESPELEDLYNYFHYHPFDADKYYKKFIDIENPLINSPLPGLLLPEAKKIFWNDKSTIVYHGRECVAEGDAMFSYRDYIIIYSYDVELKNEDFSDVSQVFPAYKNIKGYDEHDGIDGLNYIMRNLFTIEKKEEFDFIQYLQDTGETDMKVIYPVLMFFEPEKFNTNMKKIIKYIGSSLGNEQDS
jgi:hypothetical protein